MTIGDTMDVIVVALADDTEDAGVAGCLSSTFEILSDIFRHSAG